MINRLADIGRCGSDAEYSLQSVVKAEAVAGSNTLDLTRGHPKGHPMGDVSI